tara:strand:+ start:515 stop:1081 length:567 start_codon:yes stop_codon:yes gene_type:complete
MIIGIAGKKQSGKDTISDYLIDKYGFQKYGFADPIKDIAKIIFGFSEEQLYGSQKDIIDPFWNIKPRDFFQKFGTDYGQFIFPEHFPKIFKGNTRTLWVKIFQKWYLNKKKENPDIKIIINDVRFEHEFDMIKSLGGYVIKVIRPKSFFDKHISENELDKKDKDEFNNIIYNNGTKQELYDRIKDLLN